MIKIKEKEGMRYPSIDQINNKSISKYKLVLGVAKRAQEIEKTKKTYISTSQNVKSIGLALEEIVADKIEIE